MSERATLRQMTRAAKQHVGIEWDAARAAHLAERASARQRRRTLARGAIGAGVVAFAAGFLLMWGARRTPAATHGPDAIAHAAHALPAEGHGVLRFAEGSVATPLDASSELVVAAVRDDEIVVDVVHGGGRFEVTPGLPRRFRVRAGDVVVTVLGTVFTVRREGAGASVEVERGRVEVTWEPDGNAVLGAGESDAFPRAAATARVATEPTVAAASVEAEEVATAVVREERAPRRRDRRARAAEPIEQVADEEIEIEIAPEEAELEGWRALAERGRFDEGYGLLLADASVLPSRDLEALMQAADVARLSGHPSESLAYLRRALDVGRGDPRAPMVAFTLGRVLLQQLGRPSDAAAAFAQCRAMAPDGSLAQDALAREVEAWHRAGDVEQARERALEYLRLHPHGLRASAVRRYGGIE
ncbi:FecR domain-containing protein [Sandaracinus amylolyticus]|uniref:FecR domain-containing protein n=1 Tax=Sandaracinus amylolyticus TaxID=927083 RepID=UPI001F3621D9|nr:FecR family protein [Sandaracinus amylolyticus]UJR78398.1 FecR domain-containing protein [Sandaracinus amylolyticus]